MMLSRQCDEIVVGDLISAAHQFGAHDSVFAAQIVGNEFVTGIGEESP